MLYYGYMSKEKKLTRKQKAFADILLENPKLSATKAALRSYNTTDRTTASVIATENLAKPSIMKYLNDHASDAENTLLEVMNYSKDSGRENPSYAAVAVSAAKDVLDRVHGKATQKIESHSTSVNLNLSLQDITE
jgi:hypothetical protein